MAYKVNNIIGDLPKGSKSYSKRPLEGITDIVIHHSAANGKFGPYDFAKWHIEQNGWPGIGYHYVIMQDGTIYQTNSHETLSYQTGGHNTYTLGICLAGNFEEEQVPAAQLKAARWLVSKLQREITSISKVKRHGDYKGTSCPGKNMPMDEIKKKLIVTNYTLPIALAVIGASILIYAFYLYLIS